MPFSAARSNPILPADVEITPTGGAAGPDDVGRLGIELNLARPHERVGAASLRVPRDADGVYGCGALGRSRPPGRLGPARRTAQRGGRRRSRDALALPEPGSDGWAPPAAAEHLPGRRDLPSAPGDPAPRDATADTRSADHGRAASPGRPSRRAHRPAADSSRSPHAARRARSPRRGPDPGGPRGAAHAGRGRPRLGGERADAGASVPERDRIAFRRLAAESTPPPRPAASRRRRHG